MSRPRVVSLVPSLTEAVGATAADLLVGVTDWCTHPVDLAAARIGGTKNPRVPDVLALHPDVVLANQEENRETDLAALKDAGVRVWLTAFSTVPSALSGLAEMVEMLGMERPGWLDSSVAAWSAPWAGPRCQALVPIWRRPWMALGRDTFAGDVLARLGVDNVLADHADRYPRFEPAKAPRHDLVVLPDEPYAFSADDGPEVFDAPARLVSGRHLTWYGPSLATARRKLEAALWH